MKLDQHKGHFWPVAYRSNDKGTSNGG